MDAWRQLYSEWETAKKGRTRMVISEFFRILEKYKSEIADILDSANKLVIAGASSIESAIDASMRVSEHFRDMESVVSDLQLGLESKNHTIRSLQKNKEDDLLARTKIDGFEILIESFEKKAELIESDNKDMIHSIKEYVTDILKLEDKIKILESDNKILQHCLTGKMGELSHEITILKEKLKS